MDLAKFTQIRPVQMGNAFELAKLHFRLEPSEASADFIDSVGKKSFAHTCELALRYLQSDEVVERANECLRSLSADDAVEGLQERTSIELPPADVLQYAYHTCFAFPDIVDEKGMLLSEFAGSDMDHGRAIESRFPDKLVIDLIALYLNPGVLTEYRTWLSFLLRICTIFESGYSLEDIVQGWRDVKGVTGLVLAEPGTREFAARRFLHGRVLMPAKFRADLPPKMAPVMPEETDGLHSSKPTGQLRGQFDSEAIPARDYTLEKVVHMNVRLVKPGDELGHLPKIEAQKLHRPTEAMGTAKDLRGDINVGEIKRGDDQ